MRVTAIIAAGGRGRRLGAPVPKQLLAIGGRPMLQLTVDALARHPRVDALVIVLPPEVVASPPPYLSSPGGKPATLVVGGARRQDSVACGLAAVDDATDVVLVHDAARPFVDASMIDRAIDAAAESGAAICAVPSRDTVKLGERDGDAVWVARTLRRDTVFLAQTPQAFRRDVLAEAVRLGQAGVEATDEAFLAEQAGHRVRLVEGSGRNMKITSAEDLAVAQSLGDGRAMVSVGLGYDLHRLVEGRPLIIGGVTIPFERGLLGHSDADVLAHAITDAVLGAAGAGDIGRHFPDTDPRWKGAASLDLLRHAVGLAAERGLTVEHVDAVVIAERPKLAPHVPAMAAALAGVLGVDPDRVSIKGKTNEGIGEIGRGEAIAVHAVAVLRRTG
jgi:2-C-methyl-D-erythritol 4-phosphate cytidylyltransferase/2-C-methyl-D-erythritol 2,4-cyclodiphosphate synthase